VEAVDIDEGDLLDLGLGRSIYTKEQVAEFMKFQDSQGTRRAYLTETAELAYGGRGEDGSWGLGLGDRARDVIIDAVGWSLIPLYRLVGPSAVILILGLFFLSLLRIFVTVIFRAVAIFRARGAGVWLLGAFWSLPFQLLITPVRWASDAAADIAERVGADMECQAHNEETRRTETYPSSILSSLERGSRFFPPYVPRLSSEVAVVKEDS
jgi:hypothetical protein